MAFEFVNITQVIEKFTTRNKMMQRFMLAYYRPIVEKEARLARVRREDAILCVGGGYLPCTAILFHKITGANVTVIDNDKKAIRVSKEVIAKMGLSEQVKVVHTDGVDISSENYDLVHIAMQISPKEKVFKRVHDTMFEKGKILVRTPKEHLERGYQPFRTICEQKGFVTQPLFSNIEKTRLYVR